jgi:hypothetical protein
MNTCFGYYSQPTVMASPTTGRDEVDQLCYEFNAAAQSCMESGSMLQSHQFIHQIDINQNIRLQIPQQYVNHSSNDDRNLHYSNNQNLRQYQDNEVENTLRPWNPFAIDMYLHNLDEPRVILHPGDQLDPNHPTTFSPNDPAYTSSEPGYLPTPPFPPYCESTMSGDGATIPSSISTNEIPEHSEYGKPTNDYAGDKFVAPSDLENHKKDASAELEDGKTTKYFGPNTKPKLEYSNPSKNTFPIRSQHQHQHQYQQQGQHGEERRLQIVRKKSRGRTAQLSQYEGKGSENSTIRINRSPRRNHVKKSNFSSRRQTATDSKKKQRPFYCTFRFAGCRDTFPSKNEWKRHVYAQHMQLYYWLCDLPECKDRKVSVFNRKDLFGQHLKRMHCPEIPTETSTGHTNNNLLKPKPDQKTKAEKNTEWLNKELPLIQERCRKTRRLPPTRSLCGFCQRVFEGQNSWEIRMEHVGGHYENGNTECVDPDRLETDTDTDFISWALKEGLVRKESGEYKVNSVGKDALVDRKI